MPRDRGRTFEKIAKADTSTLKPEQSTTQGFDALITATADQAAANARGRR
jgi:hypothetical protein